MQPNNGSSPTDSAFTYDEPDVEELSVPAWRRVQRGNVVAQIIEQIRNRIFTSLGPGDWIGTEFELADTFGVSRPAVHEAVRALRALGLIDVRIGSGGGLRVAHSDPGRLAEAFAVQLHQSLLHWDDVSEALTIIEPGLAGLAARRRGEEDLDRLQSIVEQHRVVVSDRHAFFLSMVDFHSAVASAAGNPALMLAVKALHLNLYPLFASLDDAVGDDAIADHAAITAAIEIRDSRQAAQLMVEHLTSRRPRRTSRDVRWTPRAFSDR